jgi:hypothetical protein
VARCPLTGLVSTESNEHAPHAKASQRLKILVDQTLGAVGSCHVAPSGAPEGHRVDQPPGEDHLGLPGQSCGIPHAPQLSGQVQVQRRIDVLGDLAAVGRYHVARGVQRRHDQAAVEVLVPRGPKHAELLQPPPQRRTGL